MKKLLLMTLTATVVAGSALSGCSFSGFKKVADPATPEITVDASGSISVNPPVLVFPAGQKEVLIVWRLPKDSTLKFAERGISIDYEVTNRVFFSVPLANSKASDPREISDVAVIDRKQPEIVDCKPRGSQEFTCLNKHTRPGLYKYTIRLLDGEKKLEFDPWIPNS